MWSWTTILRSESCASDQKNKKIKNNNNSPTSSLLHHRHADTVGCHLSRVHGDPQVLRVAPVLLLLLLLLCVRPCGYGLLVPAAAAAAAAAAGGATTAVVAADHQRGEQDQQGEGQQDGQAHRVVRPLVVFVHGEAPQLVEEVQHAVALFIRHLCFCLVFICTPKNSGWIVFDLLGHLGDKNVKRGQQRCWKLKPFEAFQVQNGGHVLWWLEQREIGRHSM